jgi:hypothetical protein
MAEKSVWTCPQGHEVTSEYCPSDGAKRPTEASTASTWPVRGVEQVAPNAWQKTEPKESPAPTWGAKPSGWPVPEPEGRVRPAIDTESEALQLPQPRKAGQQAAEGANTTQPPPDQRTSAGDGWQIPLPGSPADELAALDREKQQWQLPARPKPRKGRIIAGTLGGLAGLVIAIIVITAIAKSPSTTPTASTDTTAPPTGSGGFSGGAVAPPPEAAPTATVPPAPTTTVPLGPKTTFGDGTWAVGKDIAPGTYTTQGEDGCYWERDSDLTGNFNSVLANDNGSGPSVVTILPTDAGFKSQNCGEWSPLPSSGPQATSFADGIWAVGITIAPGTYRTDGGGSCYWERESDFTANGTNSIIANDNASGPATVTINSTDKGFKSQGCGTWAKQ